MKSPDVEAVGKPRGQDIRRVEDRCLLSLILGGDLLNISTASPLRTTPLHANISWFSSTSMPWYQVGFVHLLLTLVPTPFPLYQRDLPTAIAPLCRCPAE